MKKQLFFLFFSFISFSLYANSRNVIDFNFDWKFLLGDAPQYMSPNYLDTGWQTIKLPHDWSITQAYTQDNTSASTAFLPGGIAWYRKSFQINTLKQKRYFIEFDGIYKNAEIWLNGHFIGERPYGYSGFSLELTPYLNKKDNLISVRVDHSNILDSRWYTGSGIYRKVRLIETTNTFVPQWGVWTHTIKANKDKAEIKVFTTVQSDILKPVLVKTDILNAEGTTVASGQTTITNAKDTVIQNITIKNPQLWSPDNCKLYTTRTQLVQDGQTMDVYNTRFGIRTIRFDKNQGFFLNEQNTKLKGVCLHHDAGCVGSAFIKDVWKRRLIKLKEIGVNAIRSSHNPAAPDFLDLCDELGFLVINESYDEWRRNKSKWVSSRQDKNKFSEDGYANLFERWGERDLKDMIRSSRNHPSIIMWSIGNEIEWTYSYYWRMHQANQQEGLNNEVLYQETGDGRDELKETAEQLCKWVKEDDTTRPTTTGGVLAPVGNFTGYYDVPDVMGYNYNVAQFAIDKKEIPDRLMYGSENWGRYSEWKGVLDNPQVSGIFVWTGIAYMGEAGPWPRKGLDISMFDFACNIGPRGHLFKTLWQDEPHTYLATKNYKEAQWKLINNEWTDVRKANWLNKWLFEDVEESWNYNSGDSVFVEVYSNSPEVELFVNKKSYGIQKTDAFDDRLVKFLVPYAPGKIEALGLKNGEKESSYHINTTGQAHSIKLRTDKSKITANGYDVVHIDAFIVDKKGNIITNGEETITFSYKGAGKLIGIDNGSENNVQPHQAVSITTHKGKALAIFQSTRTPGSLSISAHSSELKSNKLNITIKNK